MKPRESVRFACAQCGIAFDLTIAPMAEWVEELDDKDFEDTEIDAAQYCPFCGLSELGVVHDESVIAGP